MAAIDIVKHRRSVRTFDGNDLKPEDASGIIGFANSLANPYGIDIKWKLLSAVKDGLRSPVITGTDTFIAGKVKLQDHAAEAFGFEIEAIMLYADSLGVGTACIAGTLDRPAFEKALGLDEGEIMPAVSPLGYPAKKMSVRESAMRLGIKADHRLSPDKIFFDKDFDTVFDMNSNKETADLLELIRWAPSAVNKQPWRVVVSGSDIIFYEKRSKGYIDKSGFDMQAVDIGIAMSNLIRGLDEAGRSADLILSDPGIRLPQDTYYMATYRLR